MWHFDSFFQFEKWLISGLVLSLDMMLSSVGSGPGEFLEIWRFSIQSHPPDGKSSMYKIDGETLSSDMSKLLRSIEHSCSFLVGIPANCKFDIDVYCDPSASASESWTHTTGNLLASDKSSIRTIKVRSSLVLLLILLSSPIKPPLSLMFFHSSWIRYRCAPCRLQPNYEFSRPHGGRCKPGCPRSS